jgi:NAD dependent epimerase/dehydratase family enzyme
MRILVTGGSGFLGSRLMPELVKDEHEVFALTRSASSNEKVRALGATPVRGDLENTARLLTRSMIRMIGREMTTSDAAARRDLGYVGKVSRAGGLAAYRV